MADLWRKKSLDHLMADAEEGEKGLKRTLTATSLIGLGIGAIIGAGLFVRTAAAAANNAGPSVTIAFIVAAIGCALAGLCYAEFASMIPIAGSAYTYSYATIGEMVAWIIGWDLVLEYAIGAATVSIAWSEYLNKLLEYFGIQVPYAWCHSPFEHMNRVVGDANILKFPADFIAHAKDGILIIKDSQLDSLGPLRSLVETTSGIINIPAVFIVALLSLLLIRGMQGSALVNNLIVITKVTIVVLLIVLGWSFMTPANHHVNDTWPYVIPEVPMKADTIISAQGVATIGEAHVVPYQDAEGVEHNYGGILGILGAAGVVFFAFIGFDAVSTAAQEAKNPKRDMAIGILGSLAICTVLYVLFSWVLTGLATVEEFRTFGKEASVTYAIKEHMPGYDWLGKLVTVAILAGFSSVILVMLMGQSRVFYTMSRDGLVPKIFSDLHPKFRTPYKSNLIFLGFVGIFAAFVPGDIVGDMTSIGTLFAFMLVCAGVWILRVKRPDLPRQFKTPLVPLVPILGILVCGAMIYGLGWPNWLRLGVWMAVGFVFYFAYGIRKSILNKGK